MLTFDPDKVVALLVVTGWEDVDPGSFKIDVLQLTPPEMTPPEADDYGFTFTNSNGPCVSRMSALLAVRIATA